MTDSKKLDLILEKMDCLEGKVDSLDGRMDSLEGRMNSLEGEMSKFKEHVTKSIDGLKEMDEMILSEVARVHRILDKHKADQTVHIA